MVLLCNVVALGKKKRKRKHRSRSKSSVALCHGAPPSRSLLAPFPRSLLLNRTETLATRAMADRESSVALCHGVALKKKGSVEDRESGVALCYKVALKKKERERERQRQRDIGRGPREQYRSVPRGGVKKEKKGEKNDRSWTEREVYRYPSIRYK